MVNFLTATDAMKGQVVWTERKWNAHDGLVFAALIRFTVDNPGKD